MNNAEMSTAELLAAAAAKSAALSGLSAALEYGEVRALRVNGTMTLFAGDFRVTVDNVGVARCKGYVVSSTCRDLAHDVIRARGCW